jgi:hypothetical protein
MQVDMAHQRLPPGMQHRRHAHLPIETLGVRAEGAQGRPDGLEQQVVDLFGMDLDPTVQVVRQGEDQMVVGHRQHRRALALAPVLGGPALAARAMAVAAGVVKERALPAAVALQGEAAQGRRTAIQDMSAHLPLAGA